VTVKVLASGDIFIDCWIRVELGGKSLRQHFGVGEGERSPKLKWHGRISKLCRGFVTWRWIGRFVSREGRRTLSPLRTKVSGWGIAVNAHGLGHVGEISLSSTSAAKTAVSLRSGIRRR